MILTNLKQLIYWKILCLIQDRGHILKIHFQEINIKNRVYNYHFDNVFRAKKKKKMTKHVLIDEKNYKDLTIYFTRYVHSKSIKCLVWSIMN